MKWLLAGFIAVMSLCVTGCLSDDAEEDATKLTFENSSRYNVQVIPLTTEWSGFTIAPGEKIKMENIRDADFRYEPDDKVQEGSASSDRFIVFVDSPPSEKK